MTDTATPLWGRFAATRRIVGFAGELLGGLSVVGFVVAIVVNMLVFRQWRLNFIQIASSSDVFMAGFEGALSFALAATVLILPPAVIYVARLDRLVPSRYRSCAVMACLIFSLVLMVVLIVLIGVSSPLQSGLLYWRALLVSALNGGISMAAMLQFLLIESNRQTTPESERTFLGLRTRWLRSPYPFVILLIIVVSAAQELRTVLSRYEISGYVGDQHYMSPPPPGCEGKVLWMGERALVITCGGERVQHYAVVSTLNVPNLVICEPPSAAAGLPAGRNLRAGAATSLAPVGPVGCSSAAAQRSPQVMAAPPAPPPASSLAPTSR